MQQLKSHGSGKRTYVETVEQTAQHRTSPFLPSSVQSYLAEKGTQKALHFAPDYVVGLSDKLSNGLASRLQTICPLALLF